MCNEFAHWCRPGSQYSALLRCTMVLRPATASSWRSPAAATRRRRRSRRRRRIAAPLVGIADAPVAGWVAPLQQGHRPATRKKRRLRCGPCQWCPAAAADTADAPAGPTTAGPRRWSRQWQGAVAQDAPTTPSDGIAVILPASWPRTPALAKCRQRGGWRRAKRALGCFAATRC